MRKAAKSVSQEQTGVLAGFVSFESSPDELHNRCVSAWGETHRRHHSHGCISVGPGTGLLSAPAAAAFSEAVTAVLTGAPRWRDEKFSLLADSKGPSAAVLRLYEEYGRKFLDYLQGHFVVAVVDRSSRTAIVALDRFGVHGVYYTILPSGDLAFSSALSCLTEIPGIQLSISPQSIFDYTYFHMVPSPACIYQNLYKLQPAEALFYRPTSIDVTPYWSPEFSEDISDCTPDLANELRTKLDDSVADRSHSPSRIGAFLSGGLDSSTIVAILAKQGKTGASAFTIGFDSPGFDEMPYARNVAKHFSFSHVEHYLTPEELLAAIPRVADAYDEPFGNSSAIPTYYCARTAKEHDVELLLAGDGGDELFAGNERYRKQALFGYYRKIPAAVRKLAIESWLFRYPSTQDSPLLAKLHSYVSQANVPLPDRLQSYNFLHQHNARDIFHSDFLDAVDINGPLVAQRAWYSRASTVSDLNRMLHLDWKYTLADNDLRKVTRMCALAGVEVAFPMLDEDVLALSCRLDPKIKLKGSNLRHFYKYAMKGFLPDEVLSKSKHGFGLPFGNWMIEVKPLRELVSDSLSDLKHRGYFRTDFLDDIFAWHTDIHATYYGEFLWILLMLELWHRRS